jgi:hypothetical protein
MASPIPREAPVMIATFPFSPNSKTLSFAFVNEPPACLAHLVGQLIDV